MTDEVYFGGSVPALRVVEDSPALDWALAVWTGIQYPAAGMPSSNRRAYRFRLARKYCSFDRLPEKWKQIGGLVTKGRCWVSEFLAHYFAVRISGERPGRIHRDEVGCIDRFGQRSCEKP